MSGGAPSSIVAHLRARTESEDLASKNEAATRLEFIDQILRDVLGWNVEEFNPEEYVGDSAGRQERAFLDYHLRSKGSISLVVEAKKVGEAFSLSGDRRPRRVSLKTLQKNHGDELAAVVKQAKRYCLRTGTPSFVVTNGIQWIASLAFAQQVPERDLQAVVFYDLQDVEKNLSLFIDLLSPAGIANQSLRREAIGANAFFPSFADRLNNRLPAGHPSQRNYLSSELSAVMRVCFGDLTDEAHATMLEACYVSSDARNQELTKLESFAGQLPLDLPSGAEKMSRVRGAEGRFVDPETDEGESILLVGRAGSGKSTFLAMAKQRLRQAGVTAATTVILHVDLKPQTQVHSDNFSHEILIRDICDALLQQAQEEYPLHDPYEHDLLREIFSREIDKLRKSLSPDARTGSGFEKRLNETIQKHLERPDHHLKAYLGFLARKGIRALVLLDNVDRGTEPFERVTHQLAETVAKNTRATVVTSLRESTYRRGKDKGFLDVGRHTTFAISPPALTGVADKRFEYVRDRVKFDEGLRRRLRNAIEGGHASAVFDFADILSEAVLADTSKVGRCLQSLAGTNIRMAFEILEHFVTSPYTDVEKVFRYHQNRGPTGTSIYLDDFLRSVMRRDGLRYEENGSVVLNLFQVPPSAKSSHFTAIRILQFLAAHAGISEYSTVLLEDLNEKLAGLGFAPDHVTERVNRLGSAGLVNSLSKSEPPWAPTDTVRLGLAGRYYLEELVFEREYLNNLVDDTVIYDELSFQTIFESHNDSDSQWHERYQRKLFSFLIYLARAERAELSLVGADRQKHSWLIPIADRLGVAMCGADFGAAMTRSTSSGEGQRSRASTDSPRTRRPIRRR